jgi:alkylation response protein AidB-like acyl-CoA dehydrogenase
MKESSLALSASSILSGGGWLLDETSPADVFTPERLSDEQRMIVRTVAEFVQQEVLPAVDRLEQKDWALARHLVRRCGELGLLGADVEETYGGLQLDKTSSMLVSEGMAPSPSFAVTFGAHTNLVILPLSLFGTREQKEHYLPRMLAGELIGAYCLSEPGSGSDALGASARAARQADGSFVLNGEKTWISNGAFADLFVVFAKVDGDRFTAFLVERGFPGVASGHEEHKMGLHGSSTTPVVLQDVPVPAGNVLGEVGQGHKIAFNVLNFARFKLGAICVGGAKVAIGEAARYAAQRKQFGRAIASFGAIKHKLGEMVVRAYAVESLIYRTAGLVDVRIGSTPHDAGDQSAALAAFEQYAVEASIAKVAGSEMLDFVIDENVQIHGGNGFVRDYPAERHYRDARVNRIFEGTNEINRLLIPGMLVRRAVKGDLPIIAAAKKLQDELLGPAALPPGVDDRLSDELRAVESFKKATLMVLGLAMQTYQNTLPDQQEVLMHAADMLIDVYSAESAVLRALASPEAPPQDLKEDAARVFVNDAAMRIDASARQALSAMADGDTLRTMLAALRRLMKTVPVNTVALRRRLADETVAHGGYIF